MNIIAIAGRAGSGKDTIADILVREHGFVKVALADPMKRFCKELFNFSDEQLWGASEKRNAPDLRLPRPKVGTADMHFAFGILGGPQMRCMKCGSFPPNDAAGLDAWSVERCGPDHLSPRVALQQLGTEWGRRMFEDVWIDYTLRIANELLQESTFTYDPRYGFCSPIVSRHPNKGVVISDARYPNEMSKIKSVGGRIWYRPGGTDVGNHTSEQVLPAAVIDISATIPWADYTDKLPAIVRQLLELP